MHELQNRLDVGSTTIKAVVLDDKNKIIYKSYERHLSKVRELTLAKIEQQLKEQPKCLSNT